MLMPEPMGKIVASNQVEYHGVANAEEIRNRVSGKIFHYKYNASKRGSKKAAGQISLSVSLVSIGIVISERSTITCLPLHLIQTKGAIDVLVISKNFCRLTTWEEGGLRFSPKWFSICWSKFSSSGPVKFMARPPFPKRPERPIRWR